MFPHDRPLSSFLRMDESTLGIETLPQQAGVYVARRLAREWVRDGYLWWHCRYDSLVLRYVRTCSPMSGTAAD